MRTATEDPQRTESWRAFSMRPLRRLQKVTCRLLLFSIRLISTFLLPMASFSDQSNALIWFWCLYDWPETPERFHIYYFIFYSFFGVSKLRVCMFVPFCFDTEREKITKQEKKYVKQSVLVEFRHVLTPVEFLTSRYFTLSNKILEFDPQIFLRNYHKYHIYSTIFHIYVNYFYFYF